MAWNPEQYLKFTQPRFRPALDLIARIEGDPELIYDLGCGTGSAARILASRWERAKVVGVDDSAQMLAQAKAEPSRVVWEQASITDWRPERPAGLIFSNAALHWLPEHSALFPRLMGFLAPSGILAVQMPRNFGAPSHTVPIPIAFYCNPPWYAPRTVLRTDSRAGIPPAASSRVPPAP